MRITILIPCHNEEKSIKQCVQSCLDQTRKADEIIVVNDGSTDNTEKILKTFGKKIIVVNNISRGNKSYAQEKGLEYVTGDVFVATDGDTIMDKNFLKEIEKDFKDKRVAAVGGYVRSLKYNWLTAVRAYDYAIGQNVYKYAQSVVDFMLVIPGAAGAFRTDIFRKFIGFDHDTLTEDLDFTYKLHKNGLRINYNQKAIVYTQDPSTMHSYINQMRRWYGGGWQNLAKHLNQNLITHPGRALELTLVYVEGLVFSTMVFVLPAINILLAIKIFLLFEAVVFVQSIYASIKEKRKDLLKVALHYPAFMFVNSGIFLEQFMKEIILKKRNLVWFHPERVQI